MELQVINADGQVADNRLSVADETFARDFNEALVHQVVSAYLARGRAGTRAHKSRSQVNGGGAKPWRQKGTGRARAGTIRSPLWRSGGVTFAARPQDYAQKVNKKMHRSAMRSIFSELVRQERLLIVSELSVSQPKTKLLIALLAKFGVNDSALLVTKELDQTSDADKNLYLAARNLPGIEVCAVAGLNPYILVRYGKVVVTQAALEFIGESLS